MDYPKVFPHNLKHKGDNLFYLKKKCTVMMSCNLSLLCFFCAKILQSKITHLHKLLDFLQVTDHTVLLMSTIFPCGQQATTVDHKLSDKSPDPINYTIGKLSQMHFQSIGPLGRCFL